MEKKKRPEKVEQLHLLALYLLPQQQITAFQSLHMPLLKMHHLVISYFICPFCKSLYPVFCSYQREYKSKPKWWYASYENHHINFFLKPLVLLRSPLGHSLHHHVEFVELHYQSQGTSWSSSVFGYAAKPITRQDNIIHE